MNCAPAVRGLLMKVDGVTDCEVSAADKSATVTVKKGTDPEKLASAVTGRFSAKVKK
jgi:copper chaperone CopZ